MRRRRTQNGSAILEFALAGIVFIFVWIGIVQLAIGMWQYHTLQHAVKAAGAYVSLHGADCSIAPNSCAIQVKDAAQVVRNLAFGINPTIVNMTFTILAADHTTEISHVSCRLDNCLSTGTTTWPPAGNNSPGQDFTIKADFLFQSALSMVAPGSGSSQFGSVHLAGYTHQLILF